MADQQLQAQLDTLQEVLGKTITFDPSKKTSATEREVSLRETSRPSDWQEQHLTCEKPLCGETVPSLVACASAATVPADTEAWDDVTLRPGDSLDPGVAMCPWKRIEKYPSQFIGKRNRPLAQPFFDGIRKSNTWRFFELHFPGDALQSCILVPTVQFVRFLQDINARLGTELCIPRSNEAFFSLNFGQPGTPQARYVGNSRNKPEVLADEQQVLHEEAISWRTADKEHKRAWLANWERSRALVASHDSRDAAKRAKQIAERAEAKKRDMEANLRALQARLGITSAGMGGEEEQQQQFLNDATSSKPVVFLSIDIEVLEDEPRSMTEIGVAVLDTRDLHGREPGPGGFRWWECIKSHHLVVREYASHRNHKYVRGCPDMFQFGESTFPEEWDLIDTLSSILDSYTRDRDIEVMLVGQDLQGDLRYLSNAGYDVAQAVSSVDIVDTQILYQAWAADTQARNLRRILSDLRIPYAFLHNAGNDAMYTLRAMITMGVEGPMPAGETDRTAQLAGHQELLRSSEVQSDDPW
ncbi:hypothetical protein E4U57_003957 [Claviceps arundinis]|uniref:Gfd2/YDR514C-like C-terminal domain-containing protein n=1 Tax=Claviceps arundinis TaxID=1623583 RepID=A0ABQ7P5P5_9HYPO|nr:hypothetical protein E4U57_003957 [Claviceps arundinis]